MDTRFQFQLNSVMQMKSKILLTGSGGMVGQNILEHSSSTDYEFVCPTSRQLNLLDRNTVEQFVQEIKPDIVIHAAGVVGGIQANMADPERFLVDNTLMGINIIESARLNGVKRFLNMASSCMYPRNGINPLNEEQVLSGPLEPTNEGYALAKIVSNRLCEYIFRMDNSFIYRTAIPCNLYGRYDKFDPENSHMIPAVIRKIHETRINGFDEVEIWGDGTARREFMYAEDLADFVFYALTRLDEMPETLNVGLGKDYTINEYYQLIAEAVGYGGIFKHNVTKPVGMKQKLIDNTKLKKFGWAPKTDLRSGIKNTYEYFLSEV